MKNTNLYDKIAEVARELYERSGRVEGRDLDNWLRAERIIKARYSAMGEHEIINPSNMKCIRNERRKYKRLRMNGAQSNTFYSSNSKIINISIGGVAIETTQRLDILNREYILKITYKGNPLRLKGHVMWAMLTRGEKKESGDIIPVYKAGIKFNESSFYNTSSLYFSPDSEVTIEIGKVYR